MILMRENQFRGPLKGLGPENRDYFGPEMATSAASAVRAQIEKVCNFLAHSAAGIDSSS